MKIKRNLEEESKGEGLVYDVIDDLIWRKEYSMALTATIRYEKQMRSEMIKQYREELTKKLRERNERIK